MTISKRSAIDARAGRLIGEFNDLMSTASRGESVDALKLQRHFNEVSRRSFDLLKQHPRRRTKL